MPQKNAGMRNEPPTSLPMPHGEQKAAINAADAEEGEENAERKQRRR